MIHFIVDLVFMVGGFIFAPSLIFSIKRKIKMPATTTLPTAIVLTAFVGCYSGERRPPCPDLAF